MKKQITLIILIVITGLRGQEAPKVVFEDSLQLQLKSLDVRVEIIGNFATTTYDMRFFNELDRTLEGELAFPLGEGQAVSNFAMDVNGKLRDAVVVGKELARVAFESTVRQNIDPGLLEKTEGNNYKARVYPILPKAEKHIVITYEQELYTTMGHRTYELPLGISEILDDFSVSIDVLDANSLPKVQLGVYQNFFFKQSNEGCHATLKRQKHAPDTPITILIPNKENLDKVLTYTDYFYAYKKLTPNSRLKTKPKKITLLWDASYSLRNRNLEKELNVLEDYIGYLRNVEIQLVSFSNRIAFNKTFSIKNGQWAALKSELEQVRYDGGTSFNLFTTLKMTGDETLLFSDGLANLGDLEQFNKKPIYTISSTALANYDMMQTAATASGGSYINLVRLQQVEAVKKLKEEVFQYLGSRTNSDVEEVYPKGIQNVSEDFSISGKFSQKTTLELQFGYGGKVTKRLQIAIQASNETKLVKRLWAKQKLKFLNKNKKENKEDILALAKENHLITDYTSMLILDRIEDYVRYRIEPPQELRARYKELLSNRDEEEANRLAEINRMKEGIFSGYEKLLAWYTKKFEAKTNTPKTDDVEQGQTGTRTENAAARVNVEIDTLQRIVSGTVLDEDDVPLPGVNIVVKGTTTGTTTDFDGNFEINAEENDELLISYLGFSSVELDLGTSNSLRISMEPDNSYLEEVVVVAYGIQRESRATGYAVQTIRSEDEESNIMGLLSGKVAGLAISENQAAPGATSTDVLIRGLNSSSDVDTPLYIVDGTIPAEGSIPTLVSNDISNIEIINADNAVTLYGSRAANGLIIITTKEGLETKQEAIEALNEKIADKITLKSWDPDTPYIKILEKEETLSLAYDKYLEIRAAFSNSPSFYLDVADFFDKKGSRTIAIRVLTNLIEIELNNHELMKALAYKLEYFEQNDLAVLVYEKVLELRPEEPQSYRDLALALEKSGQLKKSYDFLYQLYNGDLLEKDMGARFNGIEQIAFVELTRLVNKYEKELKLKPTEKEKFGKIPVDVRVVIDWNHNDTDIDLWVYDPNKEKASYQNTLTEIGGRMSRDVTEGYGPEEFMLKKALDGKYKVVVNYFSDNVQKISGPTFLKVTLFTNYAKENEVSKTIIVRLDAKNGEIEVGSLSF